MTHVETDICVQEERPADTQHVCLNAANSVMVETDQGEKVRLCLPWESNVTEEARVEPENGETLKSKNEGEGDGRTAMA